MSDDDEFDRACETLRQQALKIRRQMQQLAKTPREHLPPREVLEAMQANLHRVLLQLRQVLEQGTVQ